MERHIGILALAAATVLLAGCETVAITALGVGASAGVSHTASSIGYRTFTAPSSQVRKASLAALGKMDITVDGVEPREQGGGELIRARSADRAIEIEIEAMSKSTTHMRAAAKRNAFVYDAATAREIIEQTSLALAELEKRPAAPAAPPASDKRPRGGKAVAKPEPSAAPNADPTGASPATTLARR